MSKINPLLYALPALPLMLRGIIDVILREPTTGQLFRSEERDVSIDRTIFLNYQQVVFPAALVLGVLQMAKGYDLHLPSYDLIVAFFATMLGINSKTVGFISVWYQWSDALQEVIQLCMVLAVVQVVYLNTTVPNVILGAASIGLSLWVLGLTRKLVIICRTGVETRIRNAVLADRGERNVIPDLTVLPGSGD